MRCKCCDKVLTDVEAKSKDSLGGGYLDTCRRCRDWSIGSEVDRQAEEAEDIIYLFKSID